MSHFLGSSSKSQEPPPSKRQKAQAHKVNDSLYELWKPSGTPTMQILFFHGFQFGDSSDAHISTWESEDRSFIWPQKWLVEEFPKAHLFSVSYDGSVGKSSHPSTDMHIIGENLLSDMLSAKIGQTPNCPVVFVGYSFGGFVIKEVCNQASDKLGRSHRDMAKIKSFLHNVKGVFYYGTPHHGNSCSNNVIDHLLSYFNSFSKNTANNQLFSYFNTLGKDAARLNYEFDQLSTNYNWQTEGLGESLPTTLGRFGRGVVASEGTSRQGDNFNICVTDHWSICTPPDKKDIRFNALTGLIHNIIAKNMEVSIHKLHGLPIYPMGLERRALDIQQQLADGGILGIFGMGGIGKTTLAKQVFNIFSNEFEYTCFVDNVKGIKIHGLEDWILSRFHCGGTRAVGNRTRWYDLKGKKILIIMDDIDLEAQLNVLPEFKDFGKGSCLIITSRDRNIFKFYDKCLPYEVEFLTEEDAKKLFCQHAFGQEDIPQFLVQRNGLRENVDAMVQKCGGLPLTLEVMGRYLKGKENTTRVWKETIDKLGKALALDGSQDDRVWASLNVSVDALARNEKEMFIEVATFFFEKKLDHALEVWPHGNAETTWANLVDRSLVKEVKRQEWIGNVIEYKEVKRHEWIGVHLFEYKEVWVHEQLRDLANRITHSPRDQVIACGFSNQANPLVNQLNANQVKARIKCLRLSYPSDPAETQITLQLDSLAELQDLKYVEMEGLLTEGRGEDVTRMLSLLRYEGRDFMGEKFEMNLDKMDELAVLELKDCAVPNDFPETLGNLTNLRILWLDSLTNLDRLPENFDNVSQLRRLRVGNLTSLILPESFGKLAALEELTFWSIDVLKLPDSFGDLSSLVALRILNCKELTGLPHSFSNLQSLEELRICACDKLKRLPDNFGHLFTLREFEIEAGELQTLPGSLCDLNFLGKLKINCPKLERLPDNFGQLATLRDFKIEAADLEMLPDSLCDLNFLRKLKIKCPKLKRLPDNFGHLITLRKFEIEADELEMLPDSFCDLKFLGQLKMKCPKLKRLPGNFGQLTALENLEIVAFDLDALPDVFARLVALKRLKIVADEIKTLPNGFCLLNSLTEVEIDCPKLERLPDNLGHLSALKKITIFVDHESWENGRFERHMALKKPILADGQDTEDLVLSEHFLTVESPLKRLLDNFWELSSLEELTVKARYLERLPESIGQLHSLRKFDIQAQGLLMLPDMLCNLKALRNLKLECPKLERLPDNFGQLTAVEELKIKASGLQMLPDSFGNLKSLRNLKLDCPKLKRLPDNFGQLTALEKIEIEASGLQTLPDSFGNLKSLKNIILECAKLDRLPGNFGDFYSLEELTIKSCCLDIVPESVGRLHSLRKLTFSVERLRGLPESIKQLSSLRDIRFTFDEQEPTCSLFEHLSFYAHKLTLEGSSKSLILPSLSRFPFLKELCLYCWWNLERLPEDIGDLCSLQILEVVLCTNLQSLPETLGRISSLREVRLQGCSRLKSLPDSLGKSPSPQAASPQGDTSHEPRSRGGESSYTKGTDEGMLLTVFLCPFLTDSVLEGFGWTFVSRTWRGRGYRRQTA